MGRVFGEEEEGREGKINIKARTEIVLWIPSEGEDWGGLHAYLLLGAVLSLYLASMVDINHHSPPTAYLQLPITPWFMYKNRRTSRTPILIRLHTSPVTLLPLLRPQTLPRPDDRRRTRLSSRFISHARPKPSHPDYAGCVALKLSFRGKVTHSILSYGVSTHLRNARFTPSGTLLPSTTRLTGTKGRSSAEATRMPYSCANSQAARKVWRRDLGFEGTRLGRVS